MTELEKANRMVAEALRVLRRSTGLNWEDTIRARVENGLRSETCVECGGRGYTERYDRWSNNTFTDSCNDCGAIGSRLVPEESGE